MRKPLPQRPEDSSEKPPCIERRRAVRHVGGWVIFSAAAGAMATIGACGEAVEDGDDGDDDDGFTPTTVPPSPSPTQALVCECPATNEGSSTGLNAADLTIGEYAYNAGLQAFLCHDSDGYYAMSSVCAHSACNMGTQGGNMDYNNLSGGFSCNCHGTSYNSSGVATSGPAGVGTALTHYKVSFDGTGQIYINKVAPFVTPECRCLP